MLVPLLVAAWQSNPVPPGLVWIPGGRTEIGIGVDDLQALLLREPSARPFASALAAETPKHTVLVDGFALMTTEVTCDQYAAYVEATGALAPEEWYADAARAAAAEHAARRAKDPAAGGAPFDPHTWWLEHARGAQWRLSAEDRVRPVVSVDAHEAAAYARWAGLHVMTEEEYERAVRGDAARTYPWGEEWDDERFAATSQSSKKGGPWPVGSYPAGKSRQGVLDLAGNVWEWTSSPYVAFAGYEDHAFEFGSGHARKNVTAIAPFDPARRVVVGGSFQTPKLLVRATVRRGTDPSERTAALGFRCAAVDAPGVELARAIAADELAKPRKPTAPTIEYAPDLAAGVDGWRTRDPIGAVGWTAPDGYAVIADHRCVTFAPVKTLAAADLQALEKRSVQEGPLAIGFLASTTRIVEPPLGPGVYKLAWRGKGVRKLGDLGPHPAGAPLEEVLHLDVSRDHVIVFDLDDQPLAALDWKVTFGTERAPSATSSAPEGASGTRVLHVDAEIPSLTSKRAFLVSFDVTVETPDPDVTWRR